MLFCPKCGAILVQKAKNAGCPRCSYTSKEKANIKITEKIDEIKEIPVISKRIDIHPIVEENCPKCNHKKAYFWMQQTRSSDEAPTKFFKCVKCEETWRSYS